MMLGALFLGLSLLILSPGLIIGPSLDAGVFVTVGEAVARGDLLYVAAWDHKPPLIYVLYGAGDFALPWLDPWLVAWGLSAISLAVTGTVVARGATRLGVASLPAVAAGALALLAAGQYLTALGGGMTETVATAFAGVAFYLVVTFPGTRVAVAAGILAGAAVSTSLLLAPAVPALAVAAARYPRASRRAIALSVGTMAVPAIAVGWMLLAGNLAAAWDAVIGYSSAYRASNEDVGGYLSGPTISWTVLSFLALLWPALLGTRSLLRHAERRFVALAAWLWVAASVVMFAYQGRFFAHYAIPLVLPLGCAAAFGLADIRRLMRNRRTAAAKVALAAPVVITVMISAAAGFAGGRMEWVWWSMDTPKTEAVSAEIRRLTDAHQTILVWGNEPQLYTASNRRPGSRYVYLYPLSTAGYVTDAMVNEERARLEASPPTLVIDAGSAGPGQPGFLPLLDPRPVGNDGRTLDRLDPLREFVRDKYEAAETIEGWIVYRLRDA